MIYNLGRNETSEKLLEASFVNNLYYIYENFEICRLCPNSHDDIKSAGFKSDVFLKRGLPGFK